MATTSKSLRPLVLVHGDDDYAVRQQARQIYQQWTAEIGGMDHEVIDAQVNNSGEALKALGRLRESLQTLPFFGTGKAIWFQNCNFLGDERTATAESVTEALADLAQELKSFSWQNVRLVISAGKVDKRKTFYKTLEKIGSVQAYAAWSMDDRDWSTEAEVTATQFIKAEKKEITSQALAELVENVGPNRRDLANELEKLVIFVGQRPRVGVEDVRAIVTRHKQARAFALGDALGERDLPRLLRTLDDELWEVKLDPKKSEIGLLYGLISKVRTMILIKEMRREGWLKPASDYYRFKAQLEKIPAEKLPEDKKFNPLSMNPFVLYKAFEHSSRYTIDELINAMNLLLQCNLQLVSSSLDEILVLQQTLVQIVRGDGAEMPKRSDNA